MKKALTGIIVISLFLSCKTNAPVVNKENQDVITPQNPVAFTPADPELQKVIVLQDSIFFDAYNTCKLAQMDLMFPEDIEFYHDRGGLSTSKPDLVNSLEKNICNKVRRELLPGSIEVYPIPGYGAVQFGQHRFHNLVEKSTSRFSKFVHTWKNENGNWKLARVISLH